MGASERDGSSRLGDDDRTALMDSSIRTAGEDLLERSAETRERW